MTRRSILTVLLAVAILAAIGLVLFRGEGPSSGVREKGLITVRNATDRTITYTIKPTLSLKAAEEQSLLPGGVARYPSKTGLALAYVRLGVSRTESLRPGTPYCFRYDEYRALHLYLGSHMLTDTPDLAPFVATPMDVATRMFELAKLTKADVVYDLGCGDGRLVVVAAVAYGARGVGVDIDPLRIEEARIQAKKAGVEALVEFRVEDAMKTDLREATVLALYLLPESNKLLRPKLERELRPGATVVCHDYPIPGWDEKRTSAETLWDGAGNKHTIIVYQR
ncbi:MAG: class I SAM-dependent methyltransferase [Candidatus Aminicenantes bacterium]|nr:class I SAM-dependent methyltransferase [Candidatus Aminicenantes bacterium]